MHRPSYEPNSARGPGDLIALTRRIGDMGRIGFASGLAAASLLLCSCGAGAPQAGSSSLSVGSGPFWYMRTVGTMRAPRCLKQTTDRPGVQGRCDETVWFKVQMSTETWVGVDGTMRERTVEDWQRFASATGRARWLASKKRLPVPISIFQGDTLDVGSGHFPPPPFGPIAPDVPPSEGPPAGAGPVDVGDGLLTYAQLMALPAQPADVLALIDRAWTALRHRYAETLLRWHSPGARAVVRDDMGPIPTAARSIQELQLIANLDAAPVPARVRLALFHAAAALTGVTVTHMRNRVTVTASYPDWQPARFAFDSNNGELRSGPSVLGGPPDLAGPGTTVVAQGRVSSIFALLQGVRPIRGVSAPSLWPSPAPPLIETISPSVGGPRTVFTLWLLATAGEHAHPAPTAWLGITGSAGRGIYRGPKSAFDRCLPGTGRRVWPATTTHRDGRLVYVYRFGPSRFGLRSWCRGRYQTGLLAFPNPLPPHYTTPPYVGTGSGTSIYFRIR
jgi:hypothetical protein